MSKFIALASSAALVAVIALSQHQTAPASAAIKPVPHPTCHGPVTLADGRVSMVANIICPQ